MKGKVFSILCGALIAALNLEECTFNLAKMRIINLTLVKTDST